MAFTSSNDDHLPRRNARSFDLDDSAAKAAAWVWHLHTAKPGVSTEGRFISSQIRRRSSGNYDRKATRFRQEASIVPNMGASGSKTDTPMWDCGSNLYDTFELVSFGNRLDRSLMDDVVSITPRRPRPQEHHSKSPLHEPNGILRTHSLPRSLSQQTSKSHTDLATSTATASLSPSKFKLSKPAGKGTKARSFTGLAQGKASARWSRLRNFMSIIKKVVVLHKQVDMVGCKRSVNVIESSQRPLKKDEKVRANLSTSNLKEGGEGLRDEFPIQSTKVSSNYGGTKGSYKLSIPSKDKSKYDSKRGDLAKAYSSSAIFGSGVSTQALPGTKTRAHSESMRDAFLSGHKKGRPRREFVGEGLVFMGDRIKGSNLEGADEEEVRGDHYENVHYYKHLHHHHHHHHHHYLHHNLASESERLSPETMSRICADQSWLI